MGRPSKYPEEFRREAVELVRTTNRSRAEIAKSLGIHDGTLSNWVQKANQTTTPKTNLNEDEQAELIRLRKENTELRTDREILRKAAAYFAKETIR